MTQLGSKLIENGHWMKSNSADEFDWKASVRCSKQCCQKISATPRIEPGLLAEKQVSQQHQGKKFLGTPRIKPGAAGWEATTLLLCCAPPVKYIYFNSFGKSLLIHFPENGNNVVFSFSCTFMIFKFNFRLSSFTNIWAQCRRLRPKLWRR